MSYNVDYKNKRREGRFTQEEDVAIATLMKELGLSFPSLVVLMMDSLQYNPNFSRMIPIVKEYVRNVTKKQRLDMVNMIHDEDKTNNDFFFKFKNSVERADSDDNKKGASKMIVDALVASKGDAALGNKICNWVQRRFPHRYNNCLKRLDDYNEEYGELPLKVKKVAGNKAIQPMIAIAKPKALPFNSSPLSKPKHTGPNLAEREAARLASMSPEDVKAQKRRIDAMLADNANKMMALNESHRNRPKIQFNMNDALSRKERDNALKPNALHPGQSLDGEKEKIIEGELYKNDEGLWMIDEVEDDGSVVGSLNKTAHDALKGKAVKKTFALDDNISHPAFDDKGNIIGRETETERKAKLQEKKGCEIR